MVHCEIQTHRALNGSERFISYDVTDSHLKCSKDLLKKWNNIEAHPSES